MNKATRYFILFYGLLETFIFTGNIFGWNSLHQMLLEEGIFQHLCEDVGQDIDLPVIGVDVELIDIGRTSRAVSIDQTSEKISKLSQLNETNTSYNNATEMLPLGCEAQDRILNLAFTIGSFCLGSSAFIWGFLLDRWGLRRVRLIINALLTLGTILLSLTEKNSSYLIFPSLILMCLAGVPLRLANMQIADLFPKQRSTIITLYSGAFGASASVFVFIKYGYVAGLSWEWSCFILVVFSVIMLPVTLFVLPARKVEEPSSCKKGLFSSFDCSSEVAGIATSVWGTYYMMDDSIHGAVRKQHNLNIDALNETKAQKEIKEPSHEKKELEKVEAFREKDEIPLTRSLCTSSYMMHQYWFCWLLLYTIIFVGTLHLWSERSFEDPTKGDIYGELYGLLQVAGLFLAPIGGVFMDWQVAKASKETDSEKRRLKILQSNFWPLTLTSLLAVVAQIAKYFNTAEGIIIAIVFVTLFRTFLLSIGTAYLRIRFPAEHFGKLLGIMSTMSAVFTLLQFPLYIWETSSIESAFHITIFDSICLFIACIHPLLLLITPLQKRFIEKERVEETKCAT